MVSSQQKEQLAARLMMHGVKETHARHAAEIMTSFRAMKTYDWGAAISDEAAATLASAVWVRS